MTATDELASRFLDRRLRFTTEIGTALTHDDLACDALAYGVWLEGHVTPVYVGQTIGGRRRLWDLPIGESHHLSNSFPPEVWERVVVVYWGRILDKATGILAAGTVVNLIGEVPERTAIGLGIEYLLQRQFQPLFNRRKKKRDGGWRRVEWESAASLGAKVAPHLAELYRAVLNQWTKLSTLPAGGQIECIEGKIIFPALIARSMLAGSPSLEKLRRSDSSKEA